MGRLIIVQPGRAVIELPIHLASVVTIEDCEECDDGVEGMVADGRIELHRVVRLVAANRVIQTDIPLAEHAGSVYGISLESANEGQSVRIRTEGVESIPGFAFAPNQPVFAGNDGLPTQDTSDLDVDVQIGTAITLETVLIRIEAPIYKGPVL